MRKYSEEELKTYWMARCPECGWKGLACDCGGGQPMADWGDYDDCTCPQCGEVVEDVDWEGFSLSRHVKWIWRALTFWVWRRNRKANKAEAEWLADMEAKMREESA
jgi:predicted RNA-binding Zn-ribbon protein involved in translation (DUF1610 family)